MQSQFNSIALSLNIPAVCIIAIVVMIVWSAFCASNYKNMRRVGLGILIVVTLVILYITVLSRSRISASSYAVPFSTFERAKTNSELYCFMIMNMIMFLPFGFTLPFVLYGKAGKRIGWTIFLGFLFSLIIEATQEIFSIGYVDIDDVIVNTLGTAIGSLTYPLTMLLMKKKKRKTNKSEEKESPECQGCEQAR